MRRDILTASATNETYLANIENSLSTLSNSLDGVEKLCVSRRCLAHGRFQHETRPDEGLRFPNVMPHTINQIRQETVSTVS